MTNKEKECECPKEETVCCECKEHCCICKENTPTEAIVEFDDKWRWYFGWMDDDVWEKVGRKSLKQALKANTERVREEMLDAMTFDDMIDWWLKHYKGMEHMSADPETFYTITSILERCFKKLKNQ